MITPSAIVAIVGLVAVIGFLFLAITRFKWHVFLAMLVPMLGFGLLPGLDRKAFITAYSSGAKNRMRLAM